MMSKVIPARKSSAETTSEKVPTSCSAVTNGPRLLSQPPPPGLVKYSEYIDADTSVNPNKITLDMTPTQPAISFFKWIHHLSDTTSYMCP